MYFIPSFTALAGEHKDDPDVRPIVEEDQFSDSSTILPRSRVSPPVSMSSVTSAFP